MLKILFFSVVVIWANPQDWWNIANWEGVLFDFRYASNRNVLRISVMDIPKEVWIHKEAATRLQKLLVLLKKENLGRKVLIWDATRDEGVQLNLWKYAQKHGLKGYVSNPKRKSMHQYGMALDLTLTDSTGVPLDMGTDFDHFGPRASARNQDKLKAQGLLTEAQWKNRVYFSKLVRAAGYIQLPSEWWHIHALPSKFVRQNYQPFSKKLLK